jgi:hypothetical protein
LYPHLLEQGLLLGIIGVSLTLKVGLHMCVCVDGEGSPK